MADCVEAEIFAQGKKNIDFVCGIVYCRDGFENVHVTPL
jgi:hypothetical protein